MYNLKVSELAHKDLESIIKYISGNLSAPKSALNLANEFENCYAHLRENPFIFECCHDIKLKKYGYRKAIIKSYILVYKVVENKNEVIIYRIFYGRQDYNRLI